MITENTELCSSKLMRFLYTPKSTGFMDFAALITALMSTDAAVNDVDQSNTLRFVIAYLIHFLSHFFYISWTLEHINEL